MRNSSIHRAVSIAVAAVLGSSASAWALADTVERSFEIYGFAMADYIQDSKRMDPNWVDAFRPSKIAVPEGEFGANGEASFSIKQSRFGVKGTMPTGEGSPALNFKFEFDMFGTGADAGKVAVRLRHAYGEWGQLLAGQTNSLWMDIDVFPNVIDYWGPPGMVFYRTPQFRWTFFSDDHSRFAIALEKPGNDVDPGNIRLVEEFSEATVRGHQTAPDFTVAYRYDDAWGHAQLAGILRKVGYEYQVNPAEPFKKGSNTGWGLDATAAINTIGKDKLLLGAVYGHGIASYMNDGGMDLAPNAFFNPALPVPTLSAEAVPLQGLMLYYDHYWNSKFSSSIGYSYDEVSNTNFQAPDQFHRGEYASVNLLAYPAEKVMIGIEAIWGKKTDNNRQNGDDFRFQVSVKYDFGTKL